MAQDNPFLSFLESMGTGMEAGAERRSLMQRAQRGQLEPGEEVPGLGRTILKGITRAATPASTRLAQDQFRVQTAQYALENTLAKEKQQAAQIKQLSDLSIASTQAENEKNDAALLASSEEQAREAFVKGGMDSVYGLPIPKFAGADSQKQYTDFLKQLDGTSFAETASDMKQLIASASDLGISSEGKSRLVLQAEIQGRLNQYTQNPTQIRQMLNEMRALQESGDTTGAQIIGNYMNHLSAATGQVIEYSPDGRVTIRKEVIGGPDKDLSATERSDLREASRSYQELKPILDKAERQVRESPEAFGAPGELTGLLNDIKAVAGMIPGVEFTQDMTRRQVETTMDTLVTKVLPALAGTSLGRMTENDAKLLKAPLPKLELTSTAGVVEQQLDALRFRVSLAYILGRESGGSLQGILDEEGPVEFARLISRAKSEGFGREERTLERAVDQAIRDIASKPESEADSDLKTMLLELQRSGKFTKDELKSLILNNPALD